MLQLATLKTLKHICIILSIVAWSTFGTFGNSLTYDSAQYTIFLDIHDKNGIPVLNKDYVDSLRNQYTEDQDTVQLMFTHLASALISAEADVEGAIDQLLKASNLVEQSGRLELSPFLSLVEGQIYTLIGRYDDAKTHFIDANIAFRDQDIFMFLISKVYIADMLNKLDEPEESLITQNECLEILDDLKMTNTWIGQILELQLWEASNASYIMTGQLSMAEETLKKTIEMASELNQGNVLQNANGNLSFVYLQNGNYQKVLEYALPDLEYSLRMNRNKSVNGLAGVIAFTYMQLGIPDSSEKYIRMLIGYEKDFHNWTVLQNNLSTLLTYHKSKNQLDSAFNVISRYLVLIDSIVNSRKSQDYEFIQSEIKLRSATQKIENLTTLNEIKAQSIENKNRLNYILILSAFFLLVFLMIAYRSMQAFRMKNKLLERQQEQIQKQNKEIKDQRDRLESNNDRLIQMNKDKNDLIAIVAHDLRSPLNQIRGLIGLVKMDGTQLRKDQQEYLEMMSTSSSRLSEMIGRILNVNAIESNQIDLKIDKIDVGEILEMLSINFKVLADDKNITIHTSCEKAKAFVSADRNYLIQILENLISNAIKFSSSSTNIYLDCYSDQTHNKIVVKDEGPGISKSDMDKLFHKYQKLSAAPTGGEGSFGLGLSIAKKYIESMGGKIECQSELGVGTSFIITLS